MRIDNTLFSLLIYIICILIVEICADTDYYELLGIERDADDRTIRKAFKKLAIKKHPDRNKDDPNAHAEFVKINKAYEVLKDENLRKKYDQFGEKGLEDGFNGGNNYQSWQFYNDNFGIYDDDKEIVTLNRADFHKFVTNSNEMWFINFYSTYCSHCHELAPTWRKFAQEIEGTVRIGAVNCAEDPMLCQSQRVNAYPSLVFYPSGEFYQGVRDIENLSNFVIQRLRSEVLHLNSDNIESLTKDWKPYSDLPWLIDFCGSDNECMSSENRRKLAAMVEGLANVGTIDCDKEKEICDKYEISIGMQYFPAGSLDPNKSIRLEVFDCKEIQSKVIELLDPIETIDEETLNQLLDGDHIPDEPVAIWLFLNEQQAQEYKQFKRLPPLVQNDVFSFDCSSSNLCQDIAENKKFPLFLVFKSTGGYEIDYDASKDVYAAAAFIREAAASPFHVLNDVGYQHAKSGGELFIVDFFAPWCPPCLKLLSEYRRYHSKVEEGSIYSTIAIGSLDCIKYRELCSAAGVQSYPTSILFTPDGKQHRMVGYHSVDDVVQFIENALNPAVVEMTPEDFDSMVNSRDDDTTWIVDYFAPWCGPCQQLAPELQKAARAIMEYDENAKVASVDCQKYAQFCTKNNIGSYPTIRLFPAKNTKQPRRAKFYDYPNHMWRNSESIQRWVYNFLPTEVVSLGNDYWTKVLDSSEPWIVDFFAPWCGHCIQFAPVYDQIAKAMKGKVNFAKVDCDQWPGVCQGAGVQAYPSVRLYTGKTGWSRQEVWGIQIQTQNQEMFIKVVEQQLNMHDEL